MTLKSPGRGEAPATTSTETLTIKPRSKPLLTLPSKKKKSPQIKSQANVAGVSAKTEPRPKGLEMKAMMTVHTNLALQMWQGREQDIEQNVRPIIGVTRFASGMAHIWNESARDNPMADWILLITEERHQVATEVIDQNLASLREILEEQEFFDDIESATNIRPVVLPLNFHCPWGYKAAAMLKKFDDVVRLSLTATHLGLVSSRDWEVLVRESARRMRGFLGVVAMDLRVHLERSWFSKRGNKKLAAAKQEIRKLGKKFPFIPKDVMSGERRATLSPSIQVPKPDTLTKIEVHPNEVASLSDEFAPQGSSDGRKRFVQPTKNKERANWAFDFYRLKSDEPLVDLNQDADGVDQSPGGDRENAGDE